MIYYFFPFSTERYFWCFWYACQQLLWIYWKNLKCYYLVTFYKNKKN